MQIRMHLVLSLTALYNRALDGNISIALYSASLPFIRGLPGALQALLALLGEQAPGHGAQELTSNSLVLPTRSVTLDGVLNLSSQW